MKWDLNYIQKNAKPSFNFSEELIYDPALVKNLRGVNKVEKIKVEGSLKYFASINRCSVNYKVSALLNMKSAVSDKDVIYNLEDSEELMFKFVNNDDDESIFAKGNIIDLASYVWQLIVINVPLRVVNEGEKLKETSGNGWRVVSEDDLDEENEPIIDPRFESLKNYFTKDEK